MMTCHRRMFTFDHWANLVSLHAVMPAADRVPQSVTWLNHIVGAKRIWLARVTGTAMPFGVNPAFGVDEWHAQFEAAQLGWEDFFETQTNVDVTRMIHYTNLKGDPFGSQLGDILSHLPLHGQQHRGQINADLRAAGVTPPSIDFIHAARTGAIG